MTRQGRDLRAGNRALAGLLARGWARDARRWTWGTTAVLACTLGLLLGTAGLLDGTLARTFDHVSDFYTGELRVTPSRTGALPADWFADDAADALRASGATVAARVEGQYVLSRRGFLDTFAQEKEGVPIGVPGGSPDPGTAVHLGAMVGLDAGDPGGAAIASHLVAGRMPQPGAAEMEIVMSRRRAEALLSEAERGAGGPLLQRIAPFRFDITSAQVETQPGGQGGQGTRSLIHRDAKVVGLFETGVDMLDTFTIVAAAPDARGLLGQERATAANVLVALDHPAAARETALRNGWAAEDARSFAGGFVGQVVAVLQWAAWLVTGLLFLLPTLLVGHGLARQLASQQRELAVATAIGVPRRTLGNALGLQVLAMAGWAAVAAAVLATIMALALPSALRWMPAPLPLGFLVTPASAGLATAVTALAMLVALWVGMRSRSRLPLAAVLRTG